jgi:hypothetical protein
MAYTAFGQRRQGDWRAGCVSDGWCVCCCVCFNVDGNELSVGVDKVFMLGAGVLCDLFVEFADVGGGNGGVATGFGLGFLVSASIGSNSVCIELFVNTGYFINVFFFFIS